MTVLHMTKAAPGDPWWELQLMAALNARDSDRLDYLLRLAEAEERGGWARVQATLAVVGHKAAQS